MTASKKLIQASAGVGGGDFYPKTVDYSLRSPAGGNPLYRSQTSGSTTTWTFSSWVKLDQTTNHYFFLAGQASPYPYTTARWFADGTILFVSYPAPGDYFVRSANVLRDSSAWYHFVFVFDTTNGTANDRMRMYVNGERMQLQSSNMPPSSHSGYVNNSSYNFYINSSGYSDSTSKYMAEICLIDGQALDPTSFGEDKNGIWVPKDVSGLTFGTNGFYLDFANSGALGTDVSGNGNNFTVSGLTSSDQMIDTPTNNFPTLNPLRNTSFTLADGNLAFSDANTAIQSYCDSTFGMPNTGKYYFEGRVDNGTNPNQFFWGLYQASKGTAALRSDAYAMGYVCNAGSDQLSVQEGTTATNNLYGTTYFDTRLIWKLAYDADTGNLWLGIGGDWYGSDCLVEATANPATGTLPTMTIPAADREGLLIGFNDYRNAGDINFGQNGTFGGNETAQGNADANGIGDFYYAPPTGFKALCTANLPEPTIGPNSDILTSEVFEPILYTGNGTSQSISTLDFQPDFTWIKNRDAADNHMVFDAVRGATKYLSSNAANTEVTDAQTLSSFNSNGFSVGNNVAVNTNAEDYVAWNWKGNGSGVSNTDGDITSIVSANQDAGISIVTYTGNASYGQTVGHGLGAAPQVVICKNLVNVRNWRSYFETLGATKYINLDESGAAGTYGSWNNTAPTSTVFSTTDAPSADRATNFSGDNFVAYCFAEVEGFSSFGSYTGNGSADGPFVFTGFRPSFVMVKSSSAATSWFIMDSTRDTKNAVVRRLSPDLSQAETVDSALFDFTSNGFKLRYAGGAINTSSATYIYMAFAENPFKYSNAR